MAPPRNGNGSIHQMSLELGMLKQAVTSLTDQWKRQDDKATADRGRLHDKVEACVSEVRETRGTMQAVQQDVAELRNDMTDVDQWRAARDRERTADQSRQATLKEIGAKRLAIIGLIATTVGGLLVNWLFKDLLPRIANLFGL